MRRRLKLFLLFITISCLAMYGAMGLALEQFDARRWPDKLWVVFIVPSIVMLSAWPLLGIVDKDN